MISFEAYRLMCLKEEYGEDLYEMANIHKKRHGIDDVVIWVGAVNKKHGLRIKVSKLKNKYRRGKDFIIQMPSLDYDPSEVPKWIDQEKMDKILDWIKLNQKTLVDYENEEIDDTDEFLSMLVKV